MFGTIINHRYLRFSTKILLGSLVPLFLICLAMGGHMLWRIERDAMARLDEKGAATSRMLAKLGNIPILTHDHWALNEYVTEICSDKDTVFAVVLDRKGKTLATSTARPETEDSGDVRMYPSPILNDEKQIGTVEVGISMQRFNEEREKDFLFFGVSTLTTVGLCIILALSISTATTKPIHRMVQIMKSVEQGDFNVRQEVHGRDEISVLARGFNDMLDHIGKRDHELEKYKQSLEAMVVKRTSELDRANADLQWELKERMAVENALRESEERMRVMFDSINAGVVLLDRETRTIADLNPAALRMYGGAREDVIGQSCSSFFHPCKPEKCPVQGEGQRMELSERWLAVHNGAHLPILKAVNQVMVHGRPYLLESFVDLTEQKALKDELFAAKESAEAANRAKSIFLANMSHEIRTPMKGVIGMIDVMLRTGLDGHQRHCAEIAHSSAQSLLNVLNDILDFSKIEAGKLHLDPGPMNLRAVVEDAAQLAGPQASQKGIEVIVSYRPDTPEWFVGDEMRIRQIVTNLAGNAVKFTARGHVLISVRCDVMEGGTGDIHLSVGDTGMGIPKDVQEGLFQPFVQADGSITRNFGGTGLGLTICRGLTEMMGGRIRVESEPGEGSVFHCTFPLPLSNHPGAHNEAPLEELTGARVLVVDDNPESCRVLKETFEDWHMQVVSAESGKAALEMLASADGDSISMLILDAGMPQMDGFELLERIRSRGGATLPTVLMLSSGCCEEEALRCRSLGLSSHLAKPVCRAELLDAVLVAAGLKNRAEIGSPDHAVPSGRGRSLRILLAEDNAVNQEVALQLLADMGHEVRVVPNGSLAVEAARETGFDVILMDLQMPKMGGFEATREIRLMERETGRHIPVIAMTAHAFKQDQQRCLDEGMDDYLSKPISGTRLEEVLKRWAGGNNVVQRLSSREATASSTDAAPPSDADTSTDASADISEDASGLDDPLPVNIPDFVSRCAGRANIALRVLDAFMGTTPALMMKLQGSMQADDFGQAAQHAHALRGAAANISAVALSEAAADLEGFCRDADRARAGTCLDVVESRFSSCVDALPAVRREIENAQTPASARNGS